MLDNSVRIRPIACVCVCVNMHWKPTVKLMEIKCNKVFKSLRASNILLDNVNEKWNATYFHSLALMISLFQ